jgi:hypothetical protein
MGLWVSAILLRRSLAILRSASSTHLAGEGDKWKGDGRVDSKEHNVGREGKRLYSTTESKREVVEGENETKRLEKGDSVVISRVDSPLCMIPPRCDTAVGAHFGSAG